MRRSAGVGVHTSLPKRGPHLGKRPPPLRPRGRAPRRPPGFAGSCVRRQVGRSGGVPPRERVSGQRRLRRPHRRHGPAAAHSRPTTRRAHRTEPIEPPPTPDPAFSLPPLLPIARPPYPRLPPRRLDGSPTGLKSDTNPRIPPARPVAAAPPPAHQHPPGLTPHVYLARRGRGVRREAADPPSSKARAGSEKQAGGEATACCAQSRNP
jgi:hypothetical protein